MWYNVISPFVLIDLVLYPAYLTGTKGFDPTIFKIYIGYVPNVFNTLATYCTTYIHTIFCWKSVFYSGSTSN